MLPPKNVKSNKVSLEPELTLSKYWKHFRE